METEEIIVLLSCVSLLAGIALTGLFTQLYLYKKENPKRWKKRRVVFYSKWIAKKAELPKAERPRYKEEYLTKKRFEAFLREQKPFLNPDLKITEITYPLRTTRKSLTKFIQRAYGMSFDQCMNYWRLRELERLQFVGPIRSAIALSVSAGFWSYKVYLRTRKELEEREAARRRPKATS